MTHYVTRLLPSAVNQDDRFYGLDKKGDARQLPSSASLEEQCTISYAIKLSY